jgi:hypothetical protein
MGGDPISSTGESALLDEIDELKDKLHAREKAEAELKKQNQSLQEQVGFLAFIGIFHFVLIILVVVFSFLFLIIFRLCFVPFFSTFSFPIFHSC